MNIHGWVIGLCTLVSLVLFPLVILTPLPWWSIFIPGTVGGVWMIGWILWQVIVDWIISFRG